MNVTDLIVNKGKKTQRRTRILHVAPLILRTELMHMEEVRTAPAFERWGSTGWGRRGVSGVMEIFSILTPVYTLSKLTKVYI